MNIVDMICLEAFFLGAPSYVFYYRESNFVALHRIARVGASFSNIIFNVVFSLLEDSLGFKADPTRFWLSSK